MYGTTSAVTRTSKGTSSKYFIALPSSDSSSFHVLVHAGFRAGTRTEPGARPRPFRLDRSWIPSRRHASPRLGQMIGIGPAAATIVVAVAAAAALPTG
jgi:hypothetical protein